jgi:hypothetical protein
VILLLSLPLGIVLGLAIGGRLSGLGHLRLRGEWALVALLVLQGLLPLVSASGAGKQVLYWVWALSFPIMAGVCLLNIRVPGMALAGAGVALNAAVILLNFGMPVLPEAVAAAGGSAVVLSSTDFAHTVASARSLLPALADVLSIPGPAGIRGVASAGDVLLVCGVATVLGSAMALDEATPSRVVSPRHVAGIGRSAQKE